MEWDSKSMLYALRCVEAAHNVENIGIGKIPLQDLVERGLVKRTQVYTYYLTGEGTNLLEGLGGPFPYKLSDAS